MPESPLTIDATDLLDRIDREPFAGPAFDISPRRPLVISGVGASRVDAVVGYLVRRLDARDRVELLDIGNDRFDVRVEPIAATDEWRTPQRLHEIIAYLRSPNGCPWDRAQDWSSLAPKVAEEAYEVIDAIDDGAPEHLAEELGDLLLIVALLTQIGEELGAFTIEDVYESINRKLIRRHPHVFGDVVAETPDAVLSTWRAIKQEERTAKGTSDRPFDRLPRSMPAIEKSKAMHQAGTPGTISSPLPTPDELLGILDSMIAAGRDPEAELRDALTRRYGSGSSERAEGEGTT